MEVLELVKKINGFGSYNPMQEKVISAGLLDKSIIVSSPTASGKTIIAEIAFLNSILNRRRKAIYTCPLRALASEHAKDFKRKYGSSLSIKSVLSTGDLDSGGASLADKDAVFTTMEKLNSLITHRADWLSAIGVLVVDEIHSIGSDRGPALEMLITKLRFLNPKLQIIGLSATIPNAEELASWLCAQLVESNYRPVELREGIFLDGTVDFQNKSLEVELEEDEICSLALDTLKKGKQALVFVNTRKMSESRARKLAQIAEKNLTAEEKKVLEKFSQMALNVLESPTEQCETICSLIKMGACFHNAGLLYKQREIIEDLFKKNYLKFICATPSLAQGVNLPAYRVVLQSPYRYTDFGMDRIPVSEWKQVAGRAGRPKFDSSGEAILIAKTEIEKDDYMNYYINGRIESAKSKLGLETQLRFNLLSTIATGFIFDLESAEKFFSATLYAKQQGDLSSLFRKINSMISQLQDMGFVQTSDKRIDATLLGKRVAELYLDPLSAFAMINSLKKEKIHDFSYLYMISDTSEFYPLIGVPRQKEGELWERLQDDKSKLSVDVDSEMFSDNELLPKYWTSIMLKDWIDEVKEQELVETYKIQPGILRIKLQNSDWLIYSAFELSKVLGIESHFAPLTKLRKRLQSGIKEELIALCELAGIGRVRARRLYNAGVRGIADVKKVDVEDLGKILGEKIALKVKEQLSEAK